MRLLSAMKTDALLQARNQLYGISVGVSVVIGGALAWLSSPAQVAGTFPMALLMFVGGSTLLYVVAMIILEKDDGTLSAVIVSPMRSWEYLVSKTVTLTALATLEGALITAGALLVMRRVDVVAWPSPLLLLAMTALGAMHVLIGVVLVVRYDRIMEVLLPMGAIATFLQLPALYFVGALPHPALLAIPTAAPTMLLRGAFTELSAGEWLYALVYTGICLVALALWAGRAFEAQVVRKGR